jgi:hypothetical protein
MASFIAAEKDEAVFGLDECADFAEDESVVTGLTIVMFFSICQRYFDLWPKILLNPSFL